MVGVYGVNVGCNVDEGIMVGTLVTAVGVAEFMIRFVGVTVGGIGVAV